MAIVKNQDEDIMGIVTMSAILNTLFEDILSTNELEDPLKSKEKKKL